MGNQIYVDSVQSQQTRLAVEDQYGVLPSSPSWFRTSDMRLLPKPQFETEPVMGAGDELPSGIIVNDDFTNIEVTGKAGYVGIMYPLASMFGFPTSTLVLGDTYDHEWVWDGRRPIIPASYAAHYGLPGRADEILGVIFNGLSLTAARSGYDFSTAGFGKAIEPSVAMGGVTNEVQTGSVTGGPTALSPHLTFGGRTVVIPSAASITAATVLAALEGLASIGLGNVAVSGGPWPGTPIVVTFTGKLGGLDVALISTAGSQFTGGTGPAISFTETTPGADAASTIANVPIAPLHFSIYGGDTWAEMEAESTKLLAVYNAQMQWGEKWQRSMPVNQSKSSDGIYVGEDQEHTLNLRFGADATARNLYTNIRTGAKKYIRLHAIGPLTGDSTHTNELVIDVATMVRGSEGYGSENGIHILTWNTQIARDEVTNDAVAIRLRNTKATL